jgi:hypothetical protein
MFVSEQHSALRRVGPDGARLAFGEQHLEEGAFLAAAWHIGQPEATERPIACIRHAWRWTGSPREPRRSAKVVASMNDLRITISIT